MTQQFLLLRYNNTCGPFTVSELIEQQLLPTDLLWQEGISICWKQAAEFEQLHDYVQAPEQVEPVAIAASEEEIVELNVKYCKSLVELREEYNQWNEKKQARRRLRAKLRVGQFVIMLAIVMAITLQLFRSNQQTSHHEKDETSLANNQLVTVKQELLTKDQ
ncbi:hypothetical protein [Aridibaculum aurantiacum]|uniref:hypothetical protein n=1 Tax=Aridibaculum aurantiacum TaxID=2810307 RepID=UPI001A963CAA|nr:hypothetical protein [Aridibaculum aurantiacum]